jgi:serine protease Do
MKLKQVLLTIAISFVSAFAGVLVYQKLFAERQVKIMNEQQHVPARYSDYIEGNTGAVDGVDFTKAASSAVPAVVHIKTKVPAKKVRNRDMEEDQLFGPGFGSYFVPEQRASGSGVIVSEDGYIVTNNHVICDETGSVVDDINVTLSNGKSFKAKVIGRSELTDVAVLKIDGKDLPYLVFGNSDLLQTGQWVLAIGYPLTLEATVTAGIISAPGRSITMNGRPVKNVDKERSFIQTDAAVNSGNSGGALIDTNGELIGLNSAIISPTGTYAGYSFAIPVNTVKTSVKEIIQSGAFK